MKFVKFEGDDIIHEKLIPIWGDVTYKASTQLKTMSNRVFSKSCNCKILWKLSICINIYNVRTVSLSEFDLVQPKMIRFFISNSTYLHWLTPVLASLTNLFISPWSLWAPTLGSILATSPTMEHFGFPLHQPPGVKLSLSFLRLSNALSILSSTSSFLLNFLANAAPLVIIGIVSLSDNTCGCCCGGLSQEM